jgi:hypothetical protein
MGNRSLSELFQVSLHPEKRVKVTKKVFFEVQLHKQTYNLLLDTLLILTQFLCLPIQQLMHGQYEPVRVISYKFTSLKACKCCEKGFCLWCSKASKLVTYFWLKCSPSMTRMHLCTRSNFFFYRL